VRVGETKIKNASSCLFQSLQRRWACVFLVFCRKNDFLAVKGEKNMSKVDKQGKPQHI
jgi:hypothetical protein